jgi:hypothetical protein
MKLIMKAVLQWKVVGAKAEDVSHLSVTQVEEYDSDIERENEIDYDRKDKPGNFFHL